MGLLSEEDLVVFDYLKQQCITIFRERPSVNVMDIADELMSRSDVPMHYPFHHFIVPAALLVAASVSKGADEEQLMDMLDTAKERALCVPGGACGNLGACGAGVGAGIFMSIFTDSSPMSAKTWGWCNDITGRCLSTIASYDGPRCCKRTCYLSLMTSVPYANEKLGTDMVYNEKQKCAFYEKNRECKRGKCPFYPEEAK